MLAYMYTIFKMNESTQFKKAKDINPISIIINPTSLDFFLNWNEKPADVR